MAGWFEETVPGFLTRGGVYGRRAALVHLDCDLRSSALFVLSALTEAGAIAAGTVVVFDELLHYPGYERNELRALWEWAAATGAEWRWVGPPPLSRTRTWTLSPATTTHTNTLATACGLQPRHHRRSAGLQRFARVLLAARVHSHAAIREMRGRRRNRRHISSPLPPPHAPAQAPPRSLP